MIASNLILSLCCAVVAQAAGQPARPASKAAFVARPAGVLAAPDESPMNMPTAVAVSSEGRVFVADGVNDRIVEFSDEGIFLGSFAAVGSERLSRPMSLKVGSANALWIVDTGHGRVLVRSADGKLERVIAGPAGSDLTDLALGPDQILWLIDNDGHRVIRHNLGTGESLPYGSYGEARGQFQYPFLATVDRAGVLYISDAINGRVQGIRDFETIPRVVGSYGVEGGQFHRPKGIVIDDAGRIIVVDGSLGVVQFFGPDGVYLDVLRDSTGNVLHFDLPCGIALHRDFLYVTEMHRGSVRKIALEVNEIAPRFDLPPRPQPHTQPPVCTTCHLEWMPHFNSGAATELADPPTSRKQEPYVSSARACATCHDGSVADSRRKVWLEHGHNTGVAPLPGMTVPAEMPLVDGKLACRTCHSAHTHGGAGQTMKDAVFLRVKEHPDELCIRCHSDYAGEETPGMHPTTGFQEPLHANLLAAGSRHSFKPDSAGCLICHVGHGSKADRLLIPMPSTNQMCTSCHTSVLEHSPGLGHAVLAPLSPAQQESAAAMGGKLAAGGALQCLTCHKVHHAKTESSLLVMSQAGGAMCFQCHAEQTIVQTTPHDLCVSAPQETNAKGQTCETAGPCSACHAAHGPARPGVTATADPAGQCVTCHREGACAERVTGAPFAHPTVVETSLLVRLSQVTGRKTRVLPASSVSDLTCVDCHNPHSAIHPHFLTVPPDTLCATCHALQAPVFGGPHDLKHEQSDEPNLMGRPARITGSCGFCHATHNASGPALWAATPHPAISRNDTCTNCHAEGRMASSIPKLLHPLTHFGPGDRPEKPGSGEALKFDREDLYCGSCHDPHAAWTEMRPLMLRSPDDDRPEAVCLRCHTEVALIAATPHDAAHLPSTAAEPQACAACHAIHEREIHGGVTPWTVPLASEERCRTCHREGGVAHMPYYKAHIPLPMSSSRDAPGTRMPLTDAEGRVTESGLITCITCHAPHGRLPGGGYDPLHADDSTDLVGQKTLLRPYVTPNLCSDCHGFDGLRRFLYFHSPDARQVR